MAQEIEVGAMDGLGRASMAFNERAVLGCVAVEWAEPVVRDGFAAGIVFNAGRADESLADGGVSHLAEHLVLPPVTSQNPRYGGSVSATSTELWFTGDSPEDVLDRLRGACVAIGALPQERFDRERRVLRAEGDSSGHPLNLGLRLRYGARGLGLAGYPQYGLGWLEIGDVRQWARQYLCAGNAVAWMNFEPPENFEVPLPEGELNTRNAPVNLDSLSFPVFAAGRPNEVALQLVRPRSAVGVMATQIVGQRLLAELRAARGFSYSVLTAEAPLTPLTAAATILSDVRTEHAAMAVAVISQVLRQLAADGCAESELVDITKETERWFADPRSLPGLLRGHAAAALGIQARLDGDAYLAEQRAVTLASIAACVADMTSSALLVAPSPATAPPGFSDYSSRSSRPIQGRRHQWRSTPKHAVVTAGAYVSPESLSMVHADGRQVTIDLPSAPLIVIVDDGRRALWGQDGSFVEIDRESFIDGDQLIETVDRSVPIERVRIDGDRRRQREAVRAQVGVLVDARRRRITTLVLAGLVIAAALAVQPAIGGSVLLLAVILGRLAWRTVRISLRPIPVAALTTTVQRMLQPGEQLELLASGKLQGQAAGLIMLTDRRLIFANRGSVQISLSREEELHARSSWLSSTLHIRTPDRAIRFDYVTRQSRTPIARALNTPSTRPATATATPSEAAHPLVASL